MQSIGSITKSEKFECPSLIPPAKGFKPIGEQLVLITSIFECPPSIPPAKGFNPVGEQFTLAISSFALPPPVPPVNCAEAIQGKKAVNKNDKCVKNFFTRIFLI